MVRRSLPAVWAALLAVLLQLSLGQMAMAAQGERGAPYAFAHICGQPEAAPVLAWAPAHGAPHHGGMDCLQCPLCAALAVHALVLPDCLAIPATRVARSARHIQAAETAAPHHPATAAFNPRGPPRLT